MNLGGSNASIRQDRHHHRSRLEAWHRARDERAMPMYEFTTQMATLEAPPPELQQLLGAVYGNQEAMNAFASVVAGTMSPVDFFDPAHIGEIMAAAATPA